MALGDRVRRDSYRDVGIQRVARIREDIQRYDASCGCELGSLFAVGSLLGYAAHVAFGQGQWPGWRGAGWAALSVISLSVVGKLIGLTYARVRLVQLQAQLRSELRLASRGAAPPPDARGARPVQLAGEPSGSSKEY